jgi:hypothetical protein
MVRLYGRWTSYTYMKQNEEIFCNCFMWGMEAVEGRDDRGDVNNVQYKSNRNCHMNLP